MLLRSGLRAPNVISVFMNIREGRVGSCIHSTWRACTIICRCHSSGARECVDASIVFFNWLPHVILVYLGSALPIAKRGRRHQDRCHCGSLFIFVSPTFYTSNHILFLLMLLLLMMISAHICQMPRLWRRIIKSEDSALSEPRFVELDISYTAGVLLCFSLRTLKLASSWV